MAEKNNYQGVTHVVTVTTKEDRHYCSECDKEYYFDSAVNHYIGKHGYKLLHVGTDTVTTAVGLKHNTVAVLGEIQGPILREKSPVEIHIDTGDNPIDIKSEV